MEETVKKHFAIGTILVAALAALAMVSAPQPAGQAASAPSSEKSLDFEFFKTRVEPIFLKRREEAHARCYVCHEKTRHERGFGLESLSPGSSFWTEEQSRRNFEVVSNLVVPGDPTSSLLLMHPLSPVAGGDWTVHRGGRQFESQNDPDWLTIAAWIRGERVAAPAPEAASAPNPEKSVDFEFFKTCVEPIFLKHRPGHARCYHCHASQEGPAFRLQKLSLGSTFWTEEQSRLNFQSASLLVVPGDPPLSRLLMHPLAPKAGGDIFHSGGMQFESQNDPDWLTIAAWIGGQKGGGCSDK
jgi:hypothetical protein